MKYRGCRIIVSWIGIFMSMMPTVFGQSTWTISNTGSAGSDFVSITDALASGAVRQGDVLEIIPSAQSYGSATLDKAVHLRGLPDVSGGNLEPEIELLTVPEGIASGSVTVQIERVSIQNLLAQSQNIQVESCRIGAIAATGATSLQVFRSWINLFPESRIEIASSTGVVFEGNLITVGGEATGIFSDQDSWSSFRYNTIADPSGQSEWVLYYGEFVENIVMIPEGRFSGFDLDPIGNLSTRRTFGDNLNQDNIPANEIFINGTNTIEQYLPVPNGPAIGSGTGGSDLGFTGGAHPIDLAVIPGSGKIADIPPQPVIESMEPTIGGLSLQWTVSEAIDIFELQVAIGDGPFTNASTFAYGITETLLQDLGEGVSVQVRMRSLRSDVASSWLVSAPLTTLYSPPVEPVISAIEPQIDGVNLSWSCPEAVDQYELQVSIGSGGFGDSQFLQGTSTGTALSGLGEGLNVIFRLRTIRQDLTSSWSVSDPVTTLYNPPPSPAISTLEPVVNGVNLSWSCPESVDQYELQVAVDGGAYNDPQFFPGSALGTALSNLGEGTLVVVRLRTIRNASTSSWETSNAVTTLTAFDPVLHYEALMGGDVTAYNTWLQSNWFGWFSDLENDIVLHLEHGYLHLLGNPGSVYVYDYGTGLWFWTSAIYYPSIYMFEDPPQWYLYYKGTTTPDRYFYNYKTGESIKEDAF